MLCKYTPATLKKELENLDFPDYFLILRICCLLTILHHFLTIRDNPVILVLYDRRFSQLNILLLNQLGNFTIHVISDQLPDRSSEIKIHRVKVLCHKTV